MKLIQTRKELYLLSSLMIFLLVVFLSFNYLNPVLLWDECAYLGNARNHLGGSNFVEDFRYPFLEYIIAFVWYFTGESIFAARFVVILMSLLTVFVFYLISREFFSINHSLLITFLFSISSQFILWGFRVYTDVPALMFLLLSFLSFLKYRESGKFAFISISGAFFALAFLSRFTVALFALAVFIEFVLKKDYKGFILFTSFVLLALLPWVGYNYITYDDIIWDFKEQYKIVADYTINQPATLQLNNLFLTLGLLIFFLPFGLIFLTKHKEYLIVSYVVISLVYYLFFVNMKLARYYIVFLPFLYLISYSGLLWLSERRVLKKFNFKILSLVLILSGSVFLFFGLININLENNCDSNSSILNSVQYFNSLEEKPQVIISNYWPWLGYYLNTSVSSTWDKNITNMINIYNPQYFAYNSLVGMEYNKNLLDVHERLSLVKKIEGDCNQEIFIYRVN
ncbi:MAG: glycosyltransferase family 39 protein [Candidatus Aenigmarchaeota archaeon]|nr:glycosyltransferase family 39 protein [Candidatus Aenigmarchaeota archaeon]